MKRILKALVLSGAVAAALVVPVSTASAATCAGVDYDSHTGDMQAGAWSCDPCPNPAFNLLDGQVRATVCITPR